jgi:hypothetical protein
MGIARNFTWGPRRLREEGGTDGEQSQLIKRIQWRERELRCGDKMRVSWRRRSCGSTKLIKSMLERRKAADVLGFRAEFPELLQAEVEELTPN